MEGMENNGQNSRIITRNSLNFIQQPIGKILYGNGANFKKMPDPNEQILKEPPMTLSIWTQTYQEDLDYLNEVDSFLKLPSVLSEIKPKTETERILLAEVNNLKNTQKELMDLLHSKPSTNSQHISCNISETNRQSPTSSQVEELAIQTNAEPNTITTALINTLNTSQVPAETVKYRIIAEGVSGENGDSCAPIEIQLSNDNLNCSNLNDSADSDRLEICMTDETLTNSQNEHKIFSPNKIPIPPLKRRRLKKGFDGDDAQIKLENSERSITFDEETGSYIPYINKTPLAPKIENKQLNESTSEVNYGNVLVSIGPNNTRIPAKVYEEMNWKSPSIATRKLLMAVFDRKTLATHSMTGKPSPAFKDHVKPMKSQLNPIAIQDIIFAVTRKCSVTEKQVRNAITTKCADENKMMKLQMNKRKMRDDINKENF